MSLNRAIAPQAQPFRQIPLPPYFSTHLSNGIPVYYLPFGNIEMCEIQAVFRAGGAFDTKVGLSDFTTRNMSEGTKNYTSLEFAKALDYHGAWLEFDASNEFVAIELTGLSHLTDKTLPLLRDIILHPIFPEAEFQKLKTRTLQRLELSLKKTSYLANCAFPERLFGKNHPYGANMGIPELLAIERADMVASHREYFGLGNMYLTICGNFHLPTVMKNLELVFGKEELSGKNTQTSLAEQPIESASAGRYHYELDSTQTSLRVGHLGLPRKHPATTEMGFVNTVLGGYFGSRLMSNIREEKGYTYGVQSNWSSYFYSGQFLVQCDVGNEYVEQTIEEIKREIMRLQNEPISEEELQLVKNYKNGKTINDRETLFQLNNWLRFSLINDISFEEIDRNYAEMQNISADKIQSLAQTYLFPDQLIKVTAGKKG